VYKKPDAKESDPLSMGVNIAKKLGVNSTFTTAMEMVGRMPLEKQQELVGYIANLGTYAKDAVSAAANAVIGAVSKPAKTEAEKTAAEKAAATATAAASNTTPVKEATPLVAPTPIIVRPAERPAGLPDVTQNVVVKGTLTNANVGEEGYQGHYIPPPRVPLEENENAFTDSDPNKHDELYITNTSVAQPQNVENKQVESLTPAEIEGLKQSSVLPTRYPTPISQPTSAAPTSAAQPVDNSEVSNYDYMKTAVLTAITATAVAFRNFLFENPLLAETVQKAVVQGAKTVGDVLPYLRQYINGMPREKIYQRFRSNV
jgi:hypothetical protein